MPGDVSDSRTTEHRTESGLQRNIYKIRSMCAYAVNPFKWMSKQFERLEDFQSISVVLYCVVVLLAGLPAHSYDDMMSAVILALVGIFLSLPGSLLIGAVLKLLARLYDALFSSKQS